MREIKTLCEELTEKRTSKWFETFLKHTNEKKIINDFFRSMFTKLNKYSYLDDIKILDIGSGEGVLAESLIKHVNEISNSRITYQGIDMDGCFNDTLAKKLKNTNSYVKLIKGDCFSNDLDQLDNDADIIIASNIVYYTDDVDKFNHSLLMKLKNNGMIIYMHQSEESDVNRIRSKYASKLHTKTVTNIKESIIKEKSKYFPIKIKSNINLPENIENAIEYFRSSIDNVPNEFENAKNILEFIAQTPLEIIEENNNIQEYLNDIISIMNDNSIVITSEFQIGLSKDSSIAFANNILPNIVGELRSEYDIIAKKLNNHTNSIVR